MSFRIRSVSAWEILDSRGNPTVAARCELSNGITAKAHCPSGASTARHAAAELRDGDLNRYGGTGVLRAGQNVNDVRAPALAGLVCVKPADVDARLLELDPSPNKSGLGAN